jgi:hypothetical protein
MWLADGCTHAVGNSDYLIDQVERRSRLRSARKDILKWIAAFSAAGLFGTAQLAGSPVTAVDSAWLAIGLLCFFLSLVSGVLYTTRIDLRYLYNDYRAGRALRTQLFRAKEARRTLEDFATGLSETTRSKTKLDSAATSRNV